jgi:hypothetical protein
MMSEPERSFTGWAKWMFLGGILLVAAVAVVIGFVPMAECPRVGLAEQIILRRPTGAADLKEILAGGIRLHDFGHCPRCKGSGKVSLLNLWTYRTPEAAQ